ncbi:putative Beta-glucosidase [Candidatus Xenohaliotis californiensis]|uniref:beta-N-acetylhexosaminidase n=1 Tax=Candidatus Xenohaliotis californiensis TaxID=84677 RepID=A0ABM9N966_9RICK|nr:putative Beta-glucosidase [Candidatus Xenohaliotis californiensis]
MVRRVIVGVSGEKLTDAEKQNLKTYKPLGVVLFKRNISSYDQLKKLVSEIKITLDHDYVHIAIDQEGGEVSRLEDIIKEDGGRTYSAGFFRCAHESIDGKDSLESFNLHKDINTLLKEQNILTAQKMLDLGINVNFSPVADLWRENATIKILNSRTFSSKVDGIVNSCKIVIEAMEGNGILSVVKHIPGHGCTLQDTHEDFAYSISSLDELTESDAKIFQDLKDNAKWAMVSHIIYRALDGDSPASISKKVIDFIRKHIGFSGILVTDAIEMKAVYNIDKDICKVAERAIDAGVDIVLYCEEGAAKNAEFLASIPEASDELLNKISDALPTRSTESSTALTNITWKKIQKDAERISSIK